MAKEKFYLTTAIHYANANPHMGHAYEEIISDIIARYKRLKNADTWFLTGMDEHGSKIFRLASEAGLPPQDFVDKHTNSFKELFEKISISYDDFIRTSDKERHWMGAEALWRAIEKSGDLYKKKYEGLYCIGCEGFKTERDLENGLCPLHGTAPEKVEEENYFFKLSRYESELETLISSNILRVIPETRKNEILSFIKGGLEDTSFSRPVESISWGIPVPGDKTQTMYVWCDALSNYISAVGYGRDEVKFGKYWPANLHIIGKDILRFHAVIWPAMLISAGLPLPKAILAHGFITSNGKKMSKSVGNIIDPSEIISKYGSEPFRFFLAKEISPFEDGDFTEAKLLENYNGYLANGLGNLVSRILKMSESYFGGELSNAEPSRVPAKGKGAGTIGEVEEYSVPYMIEKVFVPEYESAMERYEINRAVESLWRMISFLDSYISDYEPFKLIKTDRDKTKDIVFSLVYGLYRLGILLSPFLPNTSEKISSLIEATKEGDTITRLKTKSLTAPLFPRRD